MQNDIVKIIHQKFEDIHGVKIPNDSKINQRIFEVAQKALRELNNFGEAEINIPFLVSDKNGPKHLMTTITNDEVENFKLFSQVKSNSNNEQTTFINNIHNQNSKESSTENYIQSVMRLREKEKRSEKKSNILFFFIIILILVVVFYIAIQFFNLF